MTARRRWTRIYLNTGSTTFFKKGTDAIVCNTHFTNAELTIQDPWRALKPFTRFRANHTVWGSEKN